MKYILDASVILVYFLQPKKPGVQKKFERILKEDELYAPTLIQYEVANGLRYAQLSTEAIADFLSLFQLLDIHLVAADTTFLIDTHAIADHVKDSIYDASYHCLAIRMGATFLTFDEKYVKRAASLGHVDTFL